MQIVPYTEEFEEGIQGFDRRLAAHGSQWRIRANSPFGNWPDEELFLAIDDGGHVRGGYTLKRQEFVMDGKTMLACHYQHPVSEGIINRDHNFVGLRLLTNALARQPLLFCLGIGGHAESLAVMLRSMRWSIAEVPFFFRIVNPIRFLENIVYLRGSTWRKLTFDLLATTGVGWVALKTASLVAPKSSLVRAAEYEEIDAFEGWCDKLWHECKASYSFAAVRDFGVLNALYTGHNTKFIRLKVTVGMRPVGWAVLLATQLSGHRQFGNMILGSLVDCMAAPGFARSVVACAREHLEAVGVDLMVSNQSHASWCDALRNGGFTKGPSNFLFAASPKLTEKLRPLESTISSAHINRGDGDGPINM